MKPGTLMIYPPQMILKSYDIVLFGKDDLIPQICLAKGNMTKLHEVR